MYKGFNLELPDLERNNDFNEYYNIGLENYLEIQQPIKKTINSFLYPDKGINGTKLKENWFPKFDTDIFISHSHKDKDMAIALSGWLMKKHEISCFIDSCLWGYSEDLLKEINNNYSWLDKARSIYDYDEVNFASSHIHMMLSNALAMMIDKSECFLLINTPQSIKSYKDMEKTESPWIYAEIVMSKLLQGKPPIRPSVKLFEANESYKMGLGRPVLRIDYNLEIDHLKKIDYDFLFKKWGSKKYADKYKALDNLYKSKHKDGLLHFGLE